jgi:hypothetical protein
VLLQPCKRASLNIALTHKHGSINSARSRIAAAGMATGSSLPSNVKSTNGAEISSPDQYCVCVTSSRGQSSVEDRREAPLNSMLLPNELPRDYLGDSWF